MKIILRRLAQVALAVALLAAAGTLIPRPLLPPASAGDLARRNQTILVLSNPIHTDIAIPLDDALRTRFAFLAEAGVPIADPGAKYLVVGWGGRSFYLETPHWADIRLLPVFRALTLDRSVMHVDLAGALDENNPAITRLATDDQGLERMLAFVLSSFAEEDGRPVPILDHHYGRYDAFYEANGAFNAFVGCNTWTAQALREAGIRTGFWNPVPQTLALSLRLYN